MLAEAALPLITSAEHDRYRRFRFDRDRQLFLATRALVRTVLSRYAEVAPADWRFVADPAGKPRLSHPTLTPMLHFNLANTRGLVVCAVSVAHAAVGVDAERIDRVVHFTSVADRFFSAAEAGALRALDADRHPRRFYEYWTLKESYVKARGMGLALPLHRFSFILGGEAVAVTFDTSTGDDAARWRFALIDAAPHHIVAVALDTGDVPLSLRAETLEPNLMNPMNP